MHQSPRVRALLDRITWTEKLGQLSIVFRPALEDSAQAGPRRHRSVFWPRSAATVNTLQRVAVEETRLGIPMLVGLDVIHGQRTIAPVPLAHPRRRRRPRRRGAAGLHRRARRRDGRRALGVWATEGTDARFVVEPGLFRLHVGPTLDRTQALEPRVI